MIIFSLLISLVLERLRITPDSWKVEGVAERWGMWLSDHDTTKKWYQNDIGAPLLLVAPALLLALILSLNSNALVLLIINILVLTLVLGCRPQRAALRAFLLAAHRGDDESREAQAAIIGSHGEKQLSTGQHLVWLNFRYYFAVAFWFVLFGAAGSLAYALLRAHADKFRTLMNWIDWVPVRIAGFGYLLVGHFSRGFPVWLKSFSQGASEQCEQLCEIAQSAEDVAVNEGDYTSEPVALLNLARRTMILWLAVIAGATLFGWVT